MPLALPVSLGTKACDKKLVRTCQCPRIENKLIRSIEAGRANSSTRRTTDGGLGTWARGYSDYFTLRTALYKALLKKLKGSYEEQSYVALFFWYILPHNFSQPVNESARNAWIDAICDAVQSPYGSSVVRERLADTFSRFPESWRTLILKKLEPLIQSDPDYYASLSSEEEIPF